MLKYLIIPLSADAVSFCHYQRGTDPQLIDLETLKKALRWSMQQNLTVQFLYPESPLPDQYKSVIMSVDHADIVAASCGDDSLQNDITVIDGMTAAASADYSATGVYAVRTTLDDLIAGADTIKAIIPRVSRLVVVVTDVEAATDARLDRYRDFLDSLVDVVAGEYAAGHAVQLNLLTDRMMLESMNNCGAGVESITLAPDGRFYICPAFYLGGLDSVGDLDNGIDIKNGQLYRLDHAPICSMCDAWQCRRCVWLNRRLTREVNTPGRQQCVMAHIERSVSRRLLEKIRSHGTFLPGFEIAEIDYNDPFDKLVKSRYS